MKKIYVATKSRGFLVNLFNSDIDNIKFYYDNDKIYEVNTKLKIILSNLVKSRMADHLGIIQRINVKENSYDYIFSYNRFLKTKSNYVIYLENPLALVHYSTERIKTFVGKLKLKKYFYDPCLKSIICLSKACFDTIHNFYSIPKNVKVEQVYPFVPKNPLTSKENIKEKSHSKEINCLYISSNFILKGGRDILLTFKKLHDVGINNIKLKVITKLDNLDKKIREEINENNNIELYDFKFTKDELNHFYNDSCILLNPTRQDSFSLVVLEAMKSGNVILTTDLYAIPEMVEDEYNGFLTKPKFRFFDYNNMPNRYVWNNRNKTIYSDYIDNSVVDFLFEKLIYLNKNRNILEKMALNSFKKANSGEFSEDYIKNKWKNIFENG